MKKTITIISIALLSLSASAGNYYYYDGGKITLTEDNSKVVMFSKQDVSQALLDKNGLKVSRNLTDDISNVAILEKTGSANVIKASKMLSAQVKGVNIQPIYMDPTGLELTPTGYIYVELKSEADYMKLQQISGRFNCSIERQNKFMPLWYTLHLSEESGLNPVDVANAIYETGEFASSSPSFSSSASLMISHDPQVMEQWGLYNPENDVDISIAKAWNYSTGRDVVVAVIDVGVDMSHPDLEANIYSKSYDASKDRSPSGIYYDSNNGPLSNNHGTHCAGIVGAVRNNNKYIAGVAPDAKIMSISIDFDKTDRGEQYANAINWAWKNGADILSISWGCEKNPLVQSAINNALVYGRNNSGCVIVCAAGNKDKITGSESIVFPANHSDRVIAVGNLKKEGTISSDSCHGKDLLVCAPGTEIPSLGINYWNYKTSGTSQACPHVAGIAALILSRNPNLNAKEVRNIIAKSTKKVGGTNIYNITKEFGSWNEWYGYGLIDAYKAMMNTTRDY